MKTKNILTGILIITGTLYSFAQHVEFKEENFPFNKQLLKKAVANYDRANKYYDQGPSYYEKALDLYLKAHDFNPNHARLNYQIGNIYFTMNNKMQSTTYLEKAIELDPTYKETTLFQLAEALHQAGMFHKAITKYREVIILAQQGLEKAKKKNKQELRDDISLCELRIAQCENGINLTRDTMVVVFENLGKKINSKYPDYTAVVNADETLLVFTSRRSGNTGGKTPTGDVYQYEDIYFSQKAKNGEWSAAKKIKGKINTSDHEAPVWLSADGKKLFIYRYKGKGDIYESNYDGKEWSAPKKLSAVSTKYRETHASMTADGKTIYFTSNHEKLTTNGSMDIFKTEYNSSTKKWSQPSNIGSTINTPYDEDCVFISADGKTLYFSSQGHNSMGGFDFFKSKWENGAWSTPINFGYPINTPSNDVFIFFTADEKTAYFDSDRKGGEGEKDIYKLTLLDDVKIPLTISVYDATTKQPISANTEILQSGIDAMIQVEESATGVFKGEVPFSKNFKLDVTATGYKSHQQSFHSRFENPLKASIELDIYLEPAPVIADASETKTADSFTPSNIYFDYHVYDLREESIRVLEQVRDYLKRNPDYKVYLEGHTDHISSDGFNITLSKNRVNAAANWLIRNGINAGRIQKKWYGKSKPAVENTNVDGTDNPNNRQKNRRVEIRIEK
ncbi:MAG: PD40 domain-containing protein [Candidatus Competibacteraceae bacterium]|nr:PD40 domain-containing protein [Candidatus Competibacteraceae bacterium]